jgi:hypothetical protein
MTARIAVFVVGVLAGYVIAEMGPRTAYAQGAVTAHLMVRTLTGAILDAQQGQASALQGARVATCFTYGADGIFCVPGGQ